MNHDTHVALWKAQRQQSTMDPTETRHETVNAIMKHLDQAHDLAGSLMRREGTEDASEASTTALVLFLAIAHAQDALRDYDAVSA